MARGTGRKRRSRERRAARRRGLTINEYRQQTPDPGSRATPRTRDRDNRSDEGHYA